MDSLNVSQFLAAYNASLANVFELKASTVTGILGPKSDKIYRGELYWILVDGGARLAVRIPERYRDLSGRRVNVTGQPDRQKRKITGKSRSSCAFRESGRLTQLRKIGSDPPGRSERGADQRGQRSSVPREPHPRRRPAARADALWCQLQCGQGRAGGLGAARSSVSNRRTADPTDRSRRRRRSPLRPEGRR